MATHKSATSANGVRQVASRPHAGWRWAHLPLRPCDRPDPSVRLPDLAQPPRVSSVLNVAYILYPPPGIISVPTSCLTTLTLPELPVRFLTRSLLDIRSLQAKVHEDFDKSPPPSTVLITLATYL